MVVTTSLTLPSPALATGVCAAMGNVPLALYLPALQAAGLATATAWSYSKAPNVTALASVAWTYSGAGSAAGLPAPPSSVSSDCAVLAAAYAGWGNQPASWGAGIAAGSSCCGWDLASIPFCYQGRVTFLYLSDYNLTGTIPASLSALAYLQALCAARLHPCSPFYACEKT